MTIKNIETLNIECGKSQVELMTMPDGEHINIETEYDGEHINVWLGEAEARQLRDWLNEALEGAM
jgi:major membrane immunogen (membrane-anchored lipoprotein)